MIKKIIKELKKEEKEEIERYGRSYQFSGEKYYDLEEFFDFIFKYFELDKVLKNKNDDVFDYSNESDYFKQKHKNLIYFRELLYNIKPYLLFALKCSSLLDIDENFKKGVKEGSLVNMIENFFRLRRTGRKRVFHEYEKEEFLKFKREYLNIIEFYKEIDSWKRNDKKGSMVDYGRAIKKHNLLKEKLGLYLIQSNHWIRDCGRSTKYRFDKDILLIEDSKYNTEYVLKDYDFLLKCLKDHEEYQESLKQDQLI